jgi:uracil-DNA glycosylase
MSPSTLADHLQSLNAGLTHARTRGQTHLWISPEARLSLRAIAIALRRGGVAPGASAAPAAASAIPATRSVDHPEAKRSFADLRQSLAPTAGPVAAAPLVRNAPPVPAAPVVPPVVVPSAVVPGPLGVPEVESLSTVKLDKPSQLAAIVGDMARDPAIPALGSLRPRMVFSTGSPEARIAFIGEAPGAEEENQGEPFFGPAGQLLTKILHVMGLPRTEVYLTNVCKFRPLLPGWQGGKNRPPTGPEIAVCRPYLVQELAVVKPQLIIALGTTAAQALLPSAVDCGQLRGEWQSFQGIPWLLTDHPADLLDREVTDADKGLAAKRRVWEDMLLAMERLGMSISEKQRSFFLKPR